MVLGKLLGIDGLPLLRVDGPHAAPTQHFDEYDCCMVIGAGIGLTPVSSILRGVTQYKWKKGYKPDNIYIIWVVRHSEIPAFQWFIAQLTKSY